MASNDRVFMIVEIENADAMKHVEILNAPPRWDLSEHGQICLVAHVNGGDSIRYTDVAHQGAVIGDGNWPGRCDMCDEPFTGLRPNMTRCMNCWYSGALADAENTFSELRSIIEAAGWRAEVWQTGGMVMCLAGFPTGEALPYCLWGDPEEHDASFGVYVQDEDTMQDLMVNVPNVADLPAVLARSQEWIDQANDPAIEEVTP